MGASIRRSFATDGFFSMMMSDDMQLAIQPNGAQFIDDSLAVSVAHESDENVE